MNDDLKFFLMTCWILWGLSFVIVVDQPDDWPAGVVVATIALAAYVFWNYHEGMLPSQT